MIHFYIMSWLSDEYNDKNYSIIIREQKMLLFHYYCGNS